MSRLKAWEVREALLSVNDHSRYLDRELKTLLQNPLPNAMARNLQATPVPLQRQWTAPNDILVGLGRVESTPVPPQPQWSAPHELLARLERVEAALKLSMSQSNGTTISQAAVQDAMAETRAWVIRSADIMSMHSGMSRDTEFYVGSVAPPYALDAPLIGGDRYYNDGLAGATTPLIPPVARSHHTQTATSRSGQPTATEYNTPFGGSPAPGASHEIWLSRWDPRHQPGITEHSPVQVQPTSADLQPQWKSDGLGGLDSVARSKARGAGLHSDSR